MFSVSLFLVSSFEEVSSVFLYLGTKSGCPGALSSLLFVFVTFSGFASFVSTFDEV